MKRLAIVAGALVLAAGAAAPAGASTGRTPLQRAGAPVSASAANVSHRVAAGKQVTAGAQARVRSGWRDTHTRIFLKPGTVWHG
jgi:hypothetical protein